MTDLLFEKIKEYVEINDEDIALLKTFFHSQEIPKGSYLHKEGAIVRTATFVQKGLFRTYILDEQGNEHILQFSLPGWWTGDLASFLTGNPTRFFVEALEDSEILQITKESWDALLKVSPFYMDYHRQLLERAMIATQNRLIESYSIDAKEKYLNLLKTFPDILQRVPQYMIASYLGMSRETLSRIRKHLAEE